MSVNQQSQIPIAIIGMGCRLPGADGLDEFWQLLLHGRDAVQELPASFLDRDLYFDARQGIRGKTYSTKGGLIKNRPLDLQNCPLTQEDLSNCDPAHLIMCEVAASACRHAGYDPRLIHERLPNTGVFIGHSGGSNFGSEIVFASLIAETLEYLRDLPEFGQFEPQQQNRIIADLTARLQAGRPSHDNSGGPALGANAAASLIARALKLNGPHLVTDAACASSLVALAIGAYALQQGEIDLAIVGGASYNKPESLILFSHARSCSATGSRPFDDTADGLISSEGYVAFLLKTLPRALADGDTIQAVIPGLGISTDGRGRSLWAPRKEGQIESMRRAYGQHLDPAEIDFIEAHATSTQIGDATEMEALAEFFGPLAGQRRIPIGSVKSNLGHTLETAGVAGLLKAVLAIQHRLVPPTINVRVPNRSVPWEELPFRIANQAQPLPSHADQRPIRAAVNAFGIGGLNVHVVVDEFIGQSPARYGTVQEASPPRPMNVTRRASDSGQIAANSADDDHAIAIIGRGNILPGAYSIEEFGTLLDSGRSMIIEAPDQRWHNHVGVRTESIAPRQTPHCRGGYIADYEFDWLRYRIPPKQIANSNPLQFMLLDAARQALREAGYEDADQFDRAKTGVVVGTIFGGEFGHQLLFGLRLPEILEHLVARLQEARIDPQQVARIANDFRQLVIKQKPALVDETGSFTSSTLASRISKELNLMGGAMAVDAGECSSLAALNVAVNLLRSGACTHVLCAGAQRSMDLANYETLALQGRLSGSDPQNPQAGFVPGEGVAMVLLKPLVQARRDGNPILGVIRGVGGAFDPDHLEEAIAAANARACRNRPSMSQQVQRVIAGCNFPRQDDAERAALFTLFGGELQTDEQLGIISQTGNLLGAQGLASLIRDTVDSQSEQFTALNNLAINGQSYQVLFQPNDLAAEDVTVDSRLSHEQSPLIGDSAPQVSARHPAQSTGHGSARIYRFVGNDPLALNKQLRSARTNLDDFMANADRQRFRAGDQLRLAIVADSAAALAQKLDLAASQWQQPSAHSVLNSRGVFFRAASQAPRRVAFIFPGQGSQYTGMLKGLVASSPAARQTMEQADRILAGMGSSSFASIAWRKDNDLDGDLWSTQISVLLADIFMYQALSERGLKPDCVCGHSFGEIPALFAAGALSLEQAILVTKFRHEAIKGGRQNSQPGKARLTGGLLSLQASVEVVESWLRRLHAMPTRTNGSSSSEHVLYLTHFNAPKQVVVGGQSELLTEFASLMASAGINAERLNVPHAFHTPLMRGAKDLFSQSIRKIEIRPPQALVLSSVQNQYVAEPERIRRQLLDQLTEPVQHVQMVERLVNDGFGILVEVGPQRVLTALHRQICHDQDVLCVATDNRRQSDCPDSAQTQLLYVQAILECEGREIPQQVSTTLDLTSIDEHKSAIDMIQKSPQASGGQIQRFDATLPRRQRQRSLAAEQRTVPGVLLGHGQNSTAPIRYDATETRRKRVRDTSLNYDSRQNDSQLSQAAPVHTSANAADQAHAVSRIHQPDWADTDRSDSLQSFLIEFIVEQTGYPAEIIDIDWDFEADLGIDSIKKAQLFGELRELFDLDSMASQFMVEGRFSLDKFRTLRDVLNLLKECGGKGEWLQEGAARHKPASPASVPPVSQPGISQPGISQPGISQPVIASVEASPAVPPQSNHLAQQLATRPSAQSPGFESPADPVGTSAVTPRQDAMLADGLENFLIDFVIEQTGYPREIIELDADFEADLGIDSIKKAQLFGELREQFSLSIERFSGMDRASFGNIRTLRDVMEFLQGLPEFGGDVSQASPRLIASSAGQNLDSYPSPLVSQPATSHENGSLYPSRSVGQTARAESRSNGQAAVAGLPKHDEAYDRGLRRGQASAAEIRHVLQAAVDKYADARPALSPESARQAFTEEQLSEMEGLAAGAGVHVGGIVACNLAAREHGSVDPRGDSLDASCLLVDVPAGDSRHTEHSADRSQGNGYQATKAGKERTSHFAGSPVPPVEQPVGERLPAAGAAPKAVESDKSTDESLPVRAPVTNRYVLRTTPAPQFAGSPAVPELNGPAIILGTNSVARALQARIQHLGHVAFCIEPTQDHAAAIGELETIWKSRPAPHLFIVTSRDEDAKTQAGEEHWKRRRDVGVMLPFWFCQKWIQLVQGNKLMDDASLFAVISSGGDLGFTLPMHAIEGGGVAGLVKSILIESWVNGFRTTPIKIVDAKPDEDAATVADAVLRELASPNYDFEVAWNGGQRAKVLARVVDLPNYHAAQDSALTPPHPVARGGHWLCTGGARGITAFVCGELARRYDLTLSLVGMSPQPDIPAEWHQMSEAERKELKLSVMTAARAAGDKPIKAWEQTEKAIEIDKNLRELRAAGIRVHYYSCDVSNSVELESVLRRIRETSGPIDAVLHGAGIGKDARYENKDPKIVDQCIRAKVDGALALMELTRQDPLKYFVAFGSISGRFGANGHTDYSLANEMMAKTVGWYRDQRPDVASVVFHWHAWGDVGMATKPETRLALEMIDMEFMPAQEGLAHLINELEAGLPEREILITDDRYHRLFFPSNSLAPPTADADNAAAPQENYPLLQRGETVSHNGQTVAAIPLNPSVDPFLKEHRLDDKPLLPIVVGLEMLAEAGAREIQQTQFLELRDVEAINGLRFHNDQIQVAHVRAQLRSGEPAGVRQADCLLVADFHSRNGQLVEADRPYLSGLVCGLDRTAFKFKRTAPLPEGAWHPVEYPPVGGKFYLGPVFQQLRKIKMVGNTAWGRIAAPATVHLAGPRQPINGWLIPSAALDACLYATGLLAWFTIEPGTALPAGIGRLTVGRMPYPGEPCLVETTFQRRDGRYVYFNFSLSGNDGNTILEAEDYRIVWLSE